MAARGRRQASIIINPEPRNPPPMDTLTADAPPPVKIRKDVVVLPLSELTLTVERPQMFDSLASFERGVFSHALSVLNAWPVIGDEWGRFAQLGSRREFLMLGLTANRRCLFVGEEHVGIGTWVNRRPVVAMHWMRIVNAGAGIGEVAKVVDAFVGLW
jgi:hypothetical protein